MARILLSAYACEPDRGSEPAVGWNWAVQASRLGHRVSVLTRANNREIIEAYARCHRLDADFLYYDLPEWLQRCKRSAGELGAVLYYLLWQWFAFRWVGENMDTAQFDLVHHVTFASVRYPSFMGRLGIPFCFGPVGGGETVPASLCASFRHKARLHEFIRRISNRLVGLSPLSRSALRDASRILVTRDTLPLIPREFHKKCQVQLAIGSPEMHCAPAAKAPRRVGQPVRLLYVGRLLESKGVDVALHAVQLLKQTSLDARLTMIGDGAARRSLLELCRALDLRAEVDWLGWLPPARLDEHYEGADAFLFPGMRDSGGMAVLEALSHGLPVVCADLGGPAVIVDSSCGRVVTTSGISKLQLAESFAAAVCEIVSDAGLFAQMSTAARERAAEFEFRRLVSAVYGPVAPPSSGRQTAKP